METCSELFRLIKLLAASTCSVVYLQSSSGVACGLGWLLCTACKSVGSACIRTSTFVADRVLISWSTFVEVTEPTFAKPGQKH